MMNINVHLLNGIDSVGAQIFDHLYAYEQSINSNYTSNLQISFSNTKNLKKNAINILFAQLPRKKIEDASNYDLILLDNGDEPLIVSNQIVYETLVNNNHSYLIANSMLHSSHPLANRIIPTFNDCLLVHNYFHQPKYPQYYCQPTIQNRKNLFIINGACRAHRWHFISEILKCVPELEVKSTLTSKGVIHETKDCFFESPEDTNFKEWVNTNYPISRNSNASNSYYQKSIICGIDNKLGKIPPGYFMLDEYYNHNCIIFPETSWLNHELAITEKSIKCFLAKTFPLPLGGAFINQLYNTLGFYTAWNLLPPELQEYDSILDHNIRSKHIGLATKYLFDNPAVFETDQAKHYLDLNQVNMLLYKFNLPGAKHFLDILKKL